MPKVNCFLLLFCVSPVDISVCIGYTLIRKEKTSAAPVWRDGNYKAVSLSVKGGSQQYELRTHHLEQSSNRKKRSTCHKDR